MEENLLVHYKTNNTFQEDLEAGKVDEKALTLIEDTGKIWNRGKFYGNGEVIPTNIPLKKHTETVYSIEPNVYHVWEVVSTLDITLAAPTDTTIYNEYMIQFSTGSTLPTVSLPANIIWKDGIAPILVQNKTYQISIVDNLAIYTEF